MDEQSNIGLLKQAYDGYSKGDIQRVMGIFAQDVDWDIPEVEGLPFTGKRHGIGAVGEFFRLMDECLEAREFTPDQFIAKGDQVIVLGHCTYAVKATGTEYSDDWCHVFTIAGGKVTRFKEYTDTHKAALAFQPKGAALGAGTGAGTSRPAIH